MNKNVKSLISYAVHKRHCLISVSSNKLENGASRSSSFNWILKDCDKAIDIYQAIMSEEKTELRIWLHAWKIGNYNMPDVSSLDAIVRAVRQGDSLRLPVEWNDHLDNHPRASQYKEFLTFEVKK
jgi:hypothetical protein